MQILRGLSRILGAHGYSGDALALRDGESSGWSVLREIGAEEFTVAPIPADGTFVEQQSDGLRLTHRLGAMVLTLDSFELVRRAADGEILGDAGAEAVKLELERLRRHAETKPSAARPRRRSSRSRHGRERHRRRHHARGAHRMKIELPKDLRTFAFTELTMVELNDTDVERMLTQIFEMAIKQGRTAGNPKAAATYDEKRVALATSTVLAGFDDVRGEAVLDGWLRSSVVQMGRVGLRRDHRTDAVLPAQHGRGLPRRIPVTITSPPG